MENKSKQPKIEVTNCTSSELIKRTPLSDAELQPLLFLAQAAKANAEAIQKIAERLTGAPVVYGDTYGFYIGGMDGK